MYSPAGGHLAVALRNSARMKELAARVLQLERAARRVRSHLHVAALFTFFLISFAYS